jgi:hypothetical protein
MRTWAEWDGAVPGFVEIDLVGHEGGNSRGEFCSTLDITDIGTGWIAVGHEQGPEMRLCRHQRRDRRVPVRDPRHPFERRLEVHQLRARTGEPDFHAGPVREQERRGARGAENWHNVRQAVGYRRYDTAAELELLNRIWALQRPLTNHFGLQQKLIAEVRTGAKIRTGAVTGR